MMRPLQGDWLQGHKRQQPVEPRAERSLIKDIVAKKTVTLDEFTISGKYKYFL